MTEEELKTIENVPAGHMSELIEFARFLTDKYKDAAKQKRSRPRLIGTLEGQVWMSEDFNDPLEFVSNEEMRVLEAMRANKKYEPDLQEAAV